MINREGSSAVRIVAAAALAIILSLFLGGCSAKKSKAESTLEQYLKNNGAAEVKVDLFYTDSSFPGKAYASATVTYDFATAEGKRQQEFLGFLMKQDGEEWTIETSTKYTKDRQQAAIYLAGQKQ